MPQKITSKNDQGNFEPFNIEDLPWEQWPGSDRFKRLGKYAGGSNVGVGIDELGPGQFSNEFHDHLTEEEHILILIGSATLYLGDKSSVLRKGDHCCFLAGQKAGHLL